MNNRGNIPDYVEKPALANAVVVPGVQPAEATYEPFAPSSFYSLTEWILIPVSLISIYKWEGQSMIMILLPVVVISALGLIFLWKRNWIAKTPFEWAGIMAGFLFIGTGFSVIFQKALALSRTSLVQEVAITVILAFFPVLLGIGVIHIIMEKRERINVRKRAYLAMLGIFALFVWAGFQVGPVLAVLASVMPAHEKKSD